MYETLYQHAYINNNIILFHILSTPAERSRRRRYYYYYCVPPDQLCCQSIAFFCFSTACARAHTTRWGARRPPFENATPRTRAMARHGMTSFLPFSSARTTPARILVLYRKYIFAFFFFFFKFTENINYHFVPRLSILFIIFFFLQLLPYTEWRIRTRRK